VPPDWASPTPPYGIPVLNAANVPVAVPPVEPEGTAESGVDGTAEPTVVPGPEPAAAATPTHLDLSTVALLGRPKRAPSRGWRRWLYLGSGTLINPGEGRKAMRR
jgi:hypothetical protein